MRDPFPPTTDFGRLIRGLAPVGLTNVALEIAADADPEVDADAVRARIADLAERVRDRCGHPLRVDHVLGQINWVLFIEEKFRGNVEDYQDPANSYLHLVLGRRLGIPISLSILYAEVAAQVGLSLSGVNLPLHFVLRVDDAEPARFVDPFHGGEIRDAAGCARLIAQIAGRPVSLPPEALEPCSVAVWVARMLRNLKAIYLPQGDPSLTLPVIRRLAALQPDDLVEQRDWGMAAIQADRPGEAIGPLERFIAGSPEGIEVEAARLLLRGARRDQALRN